MDKIAVTIGAILLIGLVVWWFFGWRKAKAVVATLTDNKQQVRVTVSGGYTPNTVVLQRGVPAQIVFDRQDPSGCFSQVVFPDFGISRELPMGQQHAIDIDTSQPGEYPYACGMNMFHGKVIIK